MRYFSSKRPLPLLHFRKRVFILGPSHHVRLSGCALSSTERYETPMYDLILDAQGKTASEQCDYLVLCCVACQKHLLVLISEMQIDKGVIVLNPNNVI